MLMSRIRDWGVRPGELRVWLLIASTYIRHIGAIHPPNITKPATKPATSLTHEQVGEVKWQSATARSRTPSPAQLTCPCAGHKFSHTSDCLTWGWRRRSTHQQKHPPQLRCFPTALPAACCMYRARRFLQLGLKFA